MYIRIFIAILVLVLLFGPASAGTFTEKDKNAIVAKAIAEMDASLADAQPIESCLTTELRLGWIKETGRAYAHPLPDVCTKVREGSQRADK